MVTEVVYACLCTDNKAVKKGIDSRIISYYKHMRDRCTTCDALGYLPVLCQIVQLAQVPKQAALIVS